MPKRHVLRMIAVNAAMIGAVAASLIVSPGHASAASRPAATAQSGGAGQVPLSAAISSANPTAGNFYKIVSLTDGWCMYDYMVGYAAGLNFCVQGSSVQKWKWQSTSTPGYFKLVNLATGRCLDYQNGYATPDACAQGSTTQKWKAQSTSTSGYFKLVNLYLTPQLCADNQVTGVSVDPCAQGSNTEKWLFRSAST
jgi:hypothetical protein